MKKLLACALILCLTMGMAMADTISFSGTVEARDTKEIYAPVGGVVEEVPVKAGQTVNADTVIARIKTTKVYATEDGTITAIYGQPGDDAETVAAKYGAVMFLEGKALFTISATTKKAYEAKENYIIHPGEQVYIASRNHNANKGPATVTAVDDSGFTVQVTEGEYYVGDSFDIFRTSKFLQASRIGRGTIARVSPTVVTGTGSIVSYAVKAGDEVKRGQLLFETVEGSFDGLEMTGTEILAGVDGTVASLNVEAGVSIAEDSVVAVIYPRDAVWVAADVAETDLKDLQIGQKVKVELDWNQDQGISYEGEVEMISHLGTVGEESTTFPVYVSFTPDENTRFSMTALVSTLDENEEEADAEEAEKTEETNKSENSEETESDQDDTSRRGNGPRGDFNRGEGGQPPEGEVPEMPGESGN